MQTSEHVFSEETKALKQLLFNEKLENLRHAQDFEQPREVIGFIQALLASVSRTEAPKPADPHHRQWLRLQQYVTGNAGGSQARKRGMLEILFDSLDSLLPQERFERSARPNSWTVDGDRLEIQLNFGPDRTEEREIFSWNLKGLSCCPSEKNRSKVVPMSAVCEALQLQVEILHIIAALLRLSWKVSEWKGGDADSAKIEFWHPQLGYLPRVLQRFYSCGTQNRESRQSIWSDRIQRLRTSEMFAQNPLVECLADQVLPPHAPPAPLFARDAASGDAGAGRSSGGSPFGIRHASTYRFPRCSWRPARRPGSCLVVPLSRRGRPCQRHPRAPRRPLPPRNDDPDSTRQRRR